MPVPKSEAQAIKHDSIDLARIRKEGGKELMTSVLSAIIGETAVFFSIKNQITPNQIKQTCEMIAERYYYLKLSDLKLCFFRGRMGDYGKVYDRMDGGVILDWIAQYNEARMRTSESLSQENHRVSTGHEKETRFDGTVKGEIKKLNEFINNHKSHE